jgi:hypothetical protein
MDKFEWPDLSTLDVRKIDWSKFELPKFDRSKFEMPKFEMPKFEMPKFEAPKFEMPKFEMPKFEAPKRPDVDLPSREQVLGFARDAAYVGVGVVVLTAERMQKLQQELMDLLKSRVERVREAV